MEILTRKEAKAKGSKFYYTGKPCKHGHVDIRNALDGSCKSCNREKVKRWSDDNKEKHLEQRKVNYRNNIDRERLRCRNWYHGNRESQLTRQKKWREDNDEIYRKVLRTHRENNRDRHAAYVSVRNARKLMACPPWASKLAIEAFYASARKRTEYTGIQHHVDHVIPLNHDLVCGLHVPHNLQVITAEENILKSNNFEV